MKHLLVLYWVACGVDLWSTHLVLSAGGVESNPVGALVLQWGWVWVVVVKVALALVVTFAWVKIENVHEKGGIFVRVGIVLSSAILISAAVWNLGVTKELLYAG